MELCRLNTPWYLNKLFCPRSCSFSLWMLYSHHIPILPSNHTLKTAYLLCMWNPWNTLLSSFWYCLGSSGMWFWSCASTSQVSISQSGLWEYSHVELQIMWEVREARAWQKKSGSRIAYIAKLKKYIFAFTESVELISSYEIPPVLWLL